MIKYTQGDLLASNAEAIVNAVNCVGVMGCGLDWKVVKVHIESAFAGLHDVEVIIYSRTS